MIGQLKGVVDSIHTDHVILDVGGVGYKVFCSTASLRSLPKESEATRLYIETIVREDAFLLYGFISKAEQFCFCQLIKVGGVGSKVALAILGSLTPDQISHAVMAQDKTTFQQVSGVGPKMAVRLINELKDAFSKGDFAEIINLSPTTTSANRTQSAASDPQITANKEAIEALVQLGYQRDIACKTVASIAQQSDTPLNTADLIRLALKEFVSA